MTAPGETDLAKMLATLEVSTRPDRYAVVALPASAEVPVLGDGVAATLAEAEGWTVVATEARARREGWRVDFVARWLTLEVHSSLEAVGLTAAFATALADSAIPANVVAGFYHDHILVPADRADEAVSVLEAL